jgi:hypothetical protein
MSRLRRDTKELVLNRLHRELTQHDMPKLLHERAQWEHQEQLSPVPPLSSWWSGIGLFVAFMACLSIWLITVFAPLELKQRGMDEPGPDGSGSTHPIRSQVHQENRTREQKLPQAGRIWVSPRVPSGR